MDNTNHTVFENYYIEKKKVYRRKDKRFKFFQETNTDKIKIKS